MSAWQHPFDTIGRCGDDRHAVGHRLDHRQAETLPSAGREKNVMIDEALVLFVAAKIVFLDDSDSTRPSGQQLVGDPIKSSDDRIADSACEGHFEAP